MNRPRTVPTSPVYKSAACKYAADGPYRQCACLLTVTVGNANDGVGVIVGDNVMEGVKVIVGVKVSVIVGVKVCEGTLVAVGAGVSVHISAVAVSAVAVCVACCSGEGAHAEMNSTTSSKARYSFI